MQGAHRAEPGHAPSELQEWNWGSSARSLAVSSYPRKQAEHWGPWWEGLGGCGCRELRRHLLFSLKPMGARPPQNQDELG